MTGSSMDYNVKVYGIAAESIVDGPGIRYVVFVQGCPHCCAGCHNPQSHPLEGGQAVDIQGLFQEIRQNPLLKGVTFSGGEPFCQPQPLTALARLVHGIGLDVITYTGYQYEELLATKNAGVPALLEQTDILIDGPFIQKQKDLTLPFRGSRNQRIIDMNQTRRQGRLVLHPLY